MATAASEKARKTRMLNEFRSTLEADKKLSPQAFYLSPRPDRPQAETWPRAGGRKFRHFFKEREDGTEHLASVLNQPFGNTDMQAGGRPYNPYLHKGYREVSGQELDTIVERQQGACMARLDAAVEAEAKVNSIPVAAVEVSKGRRRSVQTNS